jgi:hypothetical protein
MLYNMSYIMALRSLPHDILMLEVVHVVNPQSIFEHATYLQAAVSMPC